MSGWESVDLFDVGVLVGEGGGVLGEERGDEVVGVASEVVDDARDSVRVDRFERVEQDERHRLVNVVDEVAREREHEPDQGRDRNDSRSGNPPGVLPTRASTRSGRRPCAGSSEG